MTHPVTQADIACAEAIIDDLTNRKGLRHEFDNIDPDIQDEIKQEWASILAQHAVRAAERMRERCAVVAEERRKYFVVGPDVRQDVKFSAREAATAIRAIPTSSGESNG